MTPRTLSTAEERRDVVVAAAQRVFGLKGVHGTATAEIAKAAGISHAYLFRLFPTKTDLVVAAVEASNERIYHTFVAVAAEARAEGRDPKIAMGESYSDLLDDPELLLMQLHAFAAAASMPAVRDSVRELFARLVELVETSTDATPEEIKSFFGHGMLMNVMSAIDAGSLDAHWVRMLRKQPEIA